MIKKMYYQLTAQEAVEASEALDYLTNTSRGHDYADDDKINEAADALAYVLDAFGVRYEGEFPDAR
ncbi:hypothetical protein PBI_ZEECULATE_60 [Mycobacterium phage Zeeculate]|nr:hypothetical protein PBI_ZEECULATE_60 [Mycobacterium phage Zeeculate]